MKTSLTRGMTLALLAPLVLVMAGCAAPEPSGSALYWKAADQYFPLAEDMHDVIMAVHDGEWAVEDGGYGAVGDSCQLGANEFGYLLNYVRVVTIDDLDPSALSAAAEQAFTGIGATPSTTVRGSGESEEHVVVAESDRVGRAVVTIRPARGQVAVTARTECTTGNAHDLAVMMFDEERLPDDVARRLPAAEFPESVPQFYFPAGGPLYVDEAGEPVTPQPVVTNPPEIPYGR